MGTLITIETPHLELSESKDTATAFSITQENGRLKKHFSTKIEIDARLTRKIVSFQANKVEASHRWYKYKEGFSAILVDYFLNQNGLGAGQCFLDPFAGSGTSLFSASSQGLAADGIELLPIGNEIIETRRLIRDEVNKNHIKRLTFWATKRPWKRIRKVEPLNELKITHGAYPADTKYEVGQFLKAIESEDPVINKILRFALLCILENISYTRKDGQYLRWDKRSGRKQGKRPFDKGRILDFSAAIIAKLNQILEDIDSSGARNDLFDRPRYSAPVKLISGSCLSVLPQLAESKYNVVITSPPYCNRYDYTRTYALELAILGESEEDIRSLRQDMLSCTVENREKDLLTIHPEYGVPIKIASEIKLLQSILQFLEEQKLQGLLNNSGIPRMIKGYFYEMSCVMFELLRVLKPTGRLYMVNDNVRYAGVAISVDLILSQIAENLGFIVEKILVLPSGKGNSSQQMGVHGREELRKCVYVWRKP